MIGRLKIAEPRWEEEAVDLIEELRGETGQDWDSVLADGLVGEQKDWPEARLYAGYRCLAERPDDGPVWLRVARLHGEFGEYDRATAILDEIDRVGGLGLFAEVFAEDPAVHRAYLLADEGRADEAHTALLALEARHGTHPLYRFALGSVLHLLAFHEEAVEEYDRALRLLREAESEAFEAGAFALTVRAVARAKGRAAAGEAFDGRRPLEIEGQA